LIREVHEWSGAYPSDDGAVKVRMDLTTEATTKATASASRRAKDELDFADSILG
jgi:hypothetical protein